MPTFPGEAAPACAHVQAGSRRRAALGARCQANSGGPGLLCLHARAGGRHAARWLASSWRRALQPQRPTRSLCSCAICCARPLRTPIPRRAGRLPAVRRNILTAIYLFNPASPAALDIGTLARQADLQMWPVRIGLVPVVAQRAAHARGAPGEQHPTGSGPLRPARDGGDAAAMPCCLRRARPASGGASRIPRRRYYALNPPTRFPEHLPLPCAPRCVQALSQATRPLSRSAWAACCP